MDTVDEAVNVSNCVFVCMSGLLGPTPIHMHWYISPCHKGITRDPGVATSQVFPGHRAQV